MITDQSTTIANNDDYRDINTSVLRYRPKSSVMVVVTTLLPKHSPIIKILFFFPKRGWLGFWR